MVEVSGPPKRRLPFKPTALRQKSEPKPDTETKDEDDGLDLFKRSKSFFPKTLADREARRKRKVNNVKEEVRSPEADAGESLNVVKNELQTSPLSPSKKSQSRQTSSRDNLHTPGPDDHGDDDIYIDDSISTPPSKRSRTSITSPEDLETTYPKREPKLSETPSKGRVSKSIPFHTPSRASATAESRPVVVLDDSSDELPHFEDEDDVYNATPIRKFRDSPAPKPDPGHADSDLEEIDDPFADDNPKKADDVPDELESWVIAARKRKEETDAAERKAKAAHVLVFVDTRIPDTKFKMIKFTLFKPLLPIKNAFCVSQVDRVFTPEEMDQVFFTWCDRRLYDTTTLTSLGIHVAVDGRLEASQSSAVDPREGFKENESVVLLTAWTEELWAEAQRKKERARLRELGELEGESEDDTDEADGGRQQAIEVPDDEKIKVILKTRKGETVKSSARPQTTAGDLVAFFRKVKNVPDTAQVLLYFDGEELDKDTTLQDAEIEDMDSIEVHVKE